MAQPLASKLAFHCQLVGGITLPVSIYSQWFNKARDNDTKTIQSSRLCPYLLLLVMATGLFVLCKATRTRTVEFIVRWQRITQCCAVSLCSVSCRGPQCHTWQQGCRHAPVERAAAEKKIKRKNELSGGKQRRHTVARHIWHSERASEQTR